MSVGAEAGNPAPDPELEAKKREADLAEAELRLQNALRSIALAKKEAETASNPDVIQAEHQKTKAQAEQAAAEAAKATFMAGLPTSSSKPLDGTVELSDKAGYFTEMLAFESTGDVAKEIAKQVTSKLGEAKNVYLVTQPDYLRGAVQLKEIEQRLDTFDKFFDGLKERYDIVGGVISSKEVPAALALAASPAVVGALADVAALFRVDRSIKGHTTTVTDDALTAQVAWAVQEIVNGKTVKIFRPSLNTTPAPAILNKITITRVKADQATLHLVKLREVLAIAGLTIEGKTAKIATAQKKLDKIAEDFAAERKEVKEEIKRLKNLFETVTPDKTAERTRLGNAITEQEGKLLSLRTDESNQQGPVLAEINQVTDELEAPKNQKAMAELAVAQYEAVIKAFNDFANKLVSVPDGGTVSPLASLAETSVLRDLEPSDLILAVSVVGQGGEVETRKSIWTSGRVYHRAGTACTYILFGKDGQITSSGLVVANRQAKEGKRINAEQ